MTSSHNGRSLFPRQLWQRWTVACGSGEFLGITAAAAIALGYRFLLGEPASTDDQLLHLFFMAAGSVLEGGILAWFQFRLIGKLFPEIAWKQWLAYTVAAALVGWMLGLLPSLFLTGGIEEAALSAPEPLAFYSLAALMGLLLGAIFGYFQWLLLKGVRQNAMLWIPANALGWALGLVFIFLGAALPDATTGWLLILLFGAAGGALGGLSVGAVSGWFLIKIARARKA